jgi:bacterioferritin-associated ferredoxin
MIICHCTKSTESEIRAAVRMGACSREEVAERCGAGSGCGGCHAAIDEIVHSERPAPLIVFVPLAKTG